MCVQTVCDNKISSLALGIPEAIAQAIIDGDSPQAIINDTITAIDAILGFVMPLCDQNY